MVTNSVHTTGTRVRIKGSPSGIELRSTTGTVIRHDEMDGYVIIRLDQPAMVYDVPETGNEISEIVESVENLEVVNPSA